MARRPRDAKIYGFRLRIKYGVTFFRRNDGINRNDEIKR